MAIIRCPYCHAIIDENDKYCNNCGTQLLFPEDEKVEEEIPGEKIIDADVEEKDYTIVEPEDEKRPAAAKELESEIDEDLEKEIQEQNEEMALDELIDQEEQERLKEDTTEEVILVDEIEAADSAERDKRRGPAEKGGAPGPGTPREEGPEEERKPEDVEEKTRVEEAETKEYPAAALRRPVPEQKAVEPPPAPLEEPVIEYVTEDKDVGTAATAGESSLRPATFDTDELEKIGETVNLGKEKIDRYIAAMAEKKAEAATPPDGPVEPSTGSLPPWASTMKGAPVFPDDTGPVETGPAAGEPSKPATEEEVEIFPRKRAADSTIGLPEKVVQAPLPFEQEAVEAGEEEEAEDVEAEEKAEAERKTGVLEEIPVSDEPIRPARPRILPVRDAERGEIEAEEEGEEPASRPPFKVAVFLKSRAFDVLFVGIFWLVALWLAALSIGQTLFEVLGSMSVPMLLLYAVLGFLYFFLFEFFLGETLGDRLFRPRE